MGAGRSSPGMIAFSRTPIGAASEHKTRLQKGTTRFEKNQNSKKKQECLLPGAKPYHTATLQAVYLLNERLPLGAKSMRERNGAIWLG